MEAYVKLKFPNEIDNLRDEKDPKVLIKEQSRVLAGLTNFYLGQMEYEHAMEFLENSLHELSLKKWAMEDDYNGKLSDIMQLVKFKPTHEVFRLLQQSYVEARAHLNSQVVEGEKRLETIEKDLE